MRVYDPIPKDLSREQPMRIPRLVMHLCAALFVATFAVLSLLPQDDRKPAAPAPD
jgi:hypothetical protein